MRSTGDVPDVDPDAGSDADLAAHLGSVPRGPLGAVVVRPAGPDDVAAVHDLGSATQSSSSTPAPRSDDPDRYLDDVDDLLVAEVDGRVVGMALLGRSTTLASNRHVLMLQGLDVHPDVQGHGLGRRLLRAAMVEARRRGATRMTLRVLAPNAVARRLYSGAGFVVEGVLRGEFVLDGRPVDDVLMARPLDDVEPSGDGGRSDL